MIIASSIPAPLIFIFRDRGGTMSSLSRRIPGLACCLVAALALGCGSGAPAHLYPVSGEVLVEGKPLAAGSVALHPDRARGNQSQDIPVGQIKEGRYVVNTGK